jgi:putative membrane protein
MQEVCIKTKSAMKTTLICLSLLAALGLTSCNNKENENNKAADNANEAKFDDSNIEKDVEFATTAASGGLMEVELGRLAVSNGGSDDVRKFGQDMITDHSKANDELKSLAASKNISLPTVPNQAHQKKIDDLQGKSGEGFDFDYIDLMVKDHKEDIDLFEKEADKGNDPDLKAWAAGKLPTLRHHLMMAEEIQRVHKDEKKDDKLNPQGMKEPRQPPRSPRTGEK